MRMTKNFYLHEFIPVSIFSRYGNNSVWFLDNRLHLGAQAVRDVLYSAIVKPRGEFSDIKMTINSRDFNERGFRLPVTKTGGALSQHKFGRAIDFSIDALRPGGAWEDFPSLEVQRLISLPENWAIIRLFFTTMEKDTVGWTHLDMRSRPESEFAKGPALVEIPST